MHNTIFIGLDPATTTGVAAVAKDGTIIYSGTVTGHGTDFVETLHGHLEAVCAGSELVGCIEDQYFAGKGKGWVNPRTVIFLARRSGICEAVLCMLGCESVWFAKAGEWRKLLGLRTRPRSKAKADALAWVAQHTDVVTSSEDEADAICMAMALRQQWTK
jgi:hypothetical protein